MENTVENKTQFQSESSIIVHPYKPAAVDRQVMAPTWLLIVLLIGAFFLLKYFIYLKDDKRHGK